MSTAPVTNGLEHVDVLIVGAGISGIAAAYSLSTQHADKTFAILEARGASGGTWDLFRYPGIRSDSDLHTFSYEFKPWRNEKAIAGAPAILDYLRETAAENGIDSKIRLHHQGARRDLVEHRRSLVGRDRADRHRRAADNQLQLVVQCRRLLPLRPRIHSAIRWP